MRRTHVAGEKLFVDYAGPTVPVIDPASGAERRAHIFVAVWGASNFTYAEATWSETKADWIGAHVNALAFAGGVPALANPPLPSTACSGSLCRGIGKEPVSWNRHARPDCFAMDVIRPSASRGSSRSREPRCDSARRATR
jgi:hypothetical protein